MRIYKRNSIFYLDYTTSSGRRIRERIGKNKKDAEKAAAAVQADLLRGVYKFKPARARITFKDFADIFLKTVKNDIKPSTFRRYLVSLKPLCEFFGDILLSEIKPFRIEQYKDFRLRQHVKPASVNRDLQLLRRMFNIAAVRQDRIEKSPFQNIELFKEEQHAVKFLNDKQAAALLNECSGNQSLYTFTLLGLSTGLRHAELLNLQWQDINFENSFIIPAKSKNSKAQPVYLSPSLVEYLASIPRRSEFVIVKPDGSKYLYMRKAFKSAARRAGLGDISPHILRHSFASSLIRSGASLVVTMAAGRWSNLSLVQRYAHTSQNEVRAAVENLDFLKKKNGTNPAQAQIIEFNAIQKTAINE